MLILQAQNVTNKSAEINDAINKIYGELLEMNKPLAISPFNENNIIFANEIDVEKLYISLEEQGSKNPRELTVFQLEVALKKNEEEFQRLKVQVDAN